MDRGSARFRAAVLLLAGLEWGQNVDRLARRTGYDRAFVARCARRLIDNGIWQHGRTVAQWTADDEASGEFWSDVAVAEGLLCRRVGADGTIEWAPPGFWNKSYQFVEPDGTPGLSVRYHDARPSATPADPASSAPMPNPATAGPPDVSDSHAGGGLARDEQPRHVADQESATPGGGSGAPSLDEVFTDAVWIR